jgi:hypothetical protein
MSAGIFALSGDCEYPGPGHPQYALQVAKLKALRQAGKQGFDEIDQGNGIVLKDRKAISQFIARIETEVRTKFGGMKP